VFFDAVTTIKITISIAQNGQGDECQTSISNSGFERLLVATDGFGFGAAVEEAIKIRCLFEHAIFRQKRKNSLL
jgi:hypothetical protein